MEAGARADLDLSETYCMQGILHLEQDRIDDAWQWADRCGDLLRKATGSEEGDSLEWGRYERLLGRIAITGSDLEAADRHLRRSAVIFQGRGSKLETGRTLYWSGLLSLAQHETEKAIQEFDKAQQIFEQLGAVPDLRQTEQQLSGITEAS
jgi:hypothetical protein